MDNQEMIHWWQGYVMINIRGEKIERLINQMMYKRFAAWDITRTSRDHAQLSISLKDFFRLRLLLKETGCRARIIRKIGLPFVLKRMGRRFGFVFGALTFCLFLYLLSTLIWSVHIEGVSLTENEILLKAELGKMGVKPGKFKFLVDDPVNIKQNLMEAIPDVTWVGFQFQGTKAILKVVEKTNPEVEEKLSPRHLVAKKKAIIYDLFVEQGEPRVKPNQYVRPGDILVSGYLGGEGDSQLVAAEGNIVGEVWYETSISLPLVRTTEIYTGEIIHEYYLSIGSLPIKVWGFNQDIGEEFRRENDEYKLTVKEWTLPFAWTKATLLATEEIKRTLTEEEAVSLALEMSRKALHRQLEPGAEIKEENVLRKQLENGKVYIKIHYTVLEDIAAEQLIYQGE